MNIKELPLKVLKEFLDNAQKKLLLIPTKKNLERYEILYNEIKRRANSWHNKR